MRIYISIPISGHDLATQQRKALEVADKLRELGHVPVSPLPPPEAHKGLSEKDFMRSIWDEILKSCSLAMQYFCARDGQTVKGVGLKHKLHWFTK